MQNNLFYNHKYSPKNQSVLRLIDKYEEQYSHLFKKIKDDWNPKIRSFMKDTLGLRLNKKYINALNNPDSFIHLIIKPDCGDEFVRLIDKNFPDLDFDEFVSLRNYLYAANNSKRYFKNEEVIHAESLIKYCDNYFHKYDLERIIKILFSERSNSTDILGGYFYHDHNVEIYYLPLIIFSNLKNINTEFLFVVVLAHEIAHAFHHIGLDNDNLSWHSMPEADINIKEGLAQYYTERFVEEYSINFPSLMLCYKSLLDSQSGPYLVHEEWIKMFKKEHVKLAFLQTRRNNIISYEKFKLALTDAKQTLK